MDDKAPDSDQLGFGFASDRPVARTEPDPDEVREDAREMLTAMRALTAETVWDARTYRLNKVVFPQMTRWLPDDERDQLCFEFFRELERIELLMAA